MKICGKCKELKPISEFNKNKDSKDGHRSTCKICSRQIVREHYKNNKGPYLARGAVNIANRKERNYLLKRDLSCIVCGEHRSVTLDFHHKDPKEKEYSISDMLRKNKTDEEIAVEIEKCVVLCSNCHRALHFGEPEERVEIEKLFT